MTDEAWASYALRVRPVVMEGLRKLAKRQRRSLNAVMGQALADYLRRQKGRKKMRWIQDNTEYNTATATAIADSGKSRDYDVPEYTLYKGSSSYDDEYWAVEHDEETGGWGISHFDRLDYAYQVYMGLPRRLVDEEEAFPSAEDESEG
jgi:hypothetical protein